MLIYVQYLTMNNKVIKGTAFHPCIMLPIFLTTHLPSNSLTNWKRQLQKVPFGKEWKGRATNPAT